jgi:hypothetical protein
MASSTADRDYTIDAFVADLEIILQHFGCSR